MVSSTVYGLEGFLDQVFAILEGYGYKVWMSHKGTIPTDPKKTAFSNCLEAVNACDAFLGIITGSYGSGTGSNLRSITHREIVRAVSQSKLRWFLVHHDVVVARQLLKQFRFDADGKKKPHTFFRKTAVLEDIRVLDMYESAIRHGLPCRGGRAIGSRNTPAMPMRFDSSRHSSKSRHAFDDFLKGERGPVMENTVLGQLLEQGESERVEFVSSVDREAHVEVAACAFLNARGGVIVAGIRDDGRIVGVPGAEAKAKAIQRRLAAAISPPAPFSVTVEEVQGKDVIVIDVPQGLEKPYVCNGRIMVRRGASVAAAGASEISSLIGQRAHSEARWERLPALGIEGLDLDAGLIRKVAETIKERRGYSIDPGKKPEKVLEGLGLMQAGQFTNAALVLFGKNPAEWYPQTRVRAARFRGDDRLEFIDNRVFEGSLFSLVEALISFVQSHTPVASTFDRDDVLRQDRLFYPLPAVREAVVNALVHRDYSAFDGGMSVAVYDGRIEFWNSGGLPDEMTVEDLRTTHPSRPINPDIAQVCFLYGLMERWGIGTQKIIRACVEGGLPEPKWTVDRNGVTLILRHSEREMTHGATGGLNVRLLNVAKRLRPGERVKLTDYLELVSKEVKERQARIDLSHLTEAGFLQRVGAGSATIYVRTAKQAPALPGDEG